MERPDFIALAGATFLPDGSVDKERGDVLWSSLFRLPEWYFLMTPKSMAAGQPSAQMIDGKVWYLVFTDTDKLSLYATRNQNLDESGKTLFMTMTPEMAIEFARNSMNTSVFGVRFNEGQEHGWFSPMKNIPMFPDYLRAKGLYP